MDYVKDDKKTYLKTAGAVILKNGIFLCLYKYREDFWLKLGESTGWGRFSCVPMDVNNLKDSKLRAFMEAEGEIRYELVEIRSPDEPEPSPLFTEASVLFCVKKAHKYIQQEIFRHILE